MSRAARGLRQSTRCFVWPYSHPSFLAVRLPAGMSAMSLARYTGLPSPMEVMSCNRPATGSSIAWRRSFPILNTALSSSTGWSRPLEPSFVISPRSACSNPIERNLSPSSIRSFLCVVLRRCEWPLRLAASLSCADPLSHAARNRTSESYPCMRGRSLLRKRGGIPSIGRKVSRSPVFSTSFFCACLEVRRSSA
jgi:hypothetical protein